ncbi:MAG: hypothetical protein CMO26_23085 [Thiotrichales bacterium]|nr:hypothetical protein [Thiotrichales bacterium]|tara:strand:- start:281 stop:616 length:336 start_codon:yes stop_codon:yes gene_type:complete
MKTAVHLLGILCLTSGMSVSAASIGNCTNDAGRARYAQETLCYDNYGPTSGKWSSRDSGPLDACLESVRGEFSASVEVCNEMYAPKLGAGFDYKRATDAGVIASGIILLLI